MKKLFSVEIIERFAVDFIDIFNEMSPYLLLGFLFAGILKVFLPQGFINNHLSKSNTKSVLLSSLIGVPMPLCSCGVIPTGVSLYKNGASKGATLSFLISTPQTGVDSILVTYSLLGLPFAIIRPFVALFTGVLGGFVSNKMESSAGEKAQNICEPDTCCDTDACNANQKQHSKLYTMLKYAFVDFLQDISKWLIVGLILAAVISVLVPDNFFEHFIGNLWIEMFAVLLVAIPLYVCATGSVPIVAALVLKGLSPGAALVFLMAGPATNIATITVLSKAIGKKATWIYVVTIIFGAILFGTIINYFLPAEWFALDTLKSFHSHHLIPNWLKWTSTVLLIILIINGFYQKKKYKNVNTMNEKVIMVNGMNCNHCKNSVETNLLKLEGIEAVNVNLVAKTAVLEGSDINLENIKQEIEKLGFEYGGEA